MNANTQATGAQGEASSGGTDLEEIMNLDSADALNDYLVKQE